MEEAKGRPKSVSELQVYVATRSQGSEQDFVVNGLQLHIGGGAGFAEKYFRADPGQCLTTSIQHGCIRGSQRIKLAGSSSRATVDSNGQAAILT